MIFRGELSVKKISSILLFKIPFLLEIAIRALSAIACVNFFMIFSLLIISRLSTDWIALILSCLLIVMGLLRVAANPKSDRSLL